MLVIDPTKGTQTLGPYDSVSDNGVVPLENCSPNGSTLSINGMLMLGCTTTPTYVINDKSPFNFNATARIWGTDEIWWNGGSDRRYYLGASKNPGTPGPNCVPASTTCPVLGVVDQTSVLLETIPVSSGSHSVAADSNQNYIFVPQTAPAPSPLGGDTTNNGAAICGTNNGCVAVYAHGNQSNPNPRP
jgi:dipeptidyl aminopeptidase/acylaminoacyl peptidase